MAFNLDCSTVELGTKSNDVTDQSQQIYTIRHMYSVIYINTNPLLLVKILTISLLSVTLKPAGLRALTLSKGCFGHSPLSCSDADRHPSPEGKSVQPMLSVTAHMNGDMPHCVTEVHSQGHSFTLGWVTWFLLS